MEGDDIVQTTLKNVGSHQRWPRHIDYLELTSFSILAVRKVTNSSDKFLNPWWVTGFCDAESSFSIFIQKS